MAPEACHVEYKHAGLHFTDYRKPLQVKNIIEFDQKFCLINLQLKQRFNILGKMLRTQNRHVLISNPVKNNLMSRKPAGFFCIICVLGKKNLLLSESDILCCNM